MSRPSLALRRPAAGRRLSDHQGKQFDTGTHLGGLRIIQAIVRAGAVSRTPYILPRLSETKQLDLLNEGIMLIQEIPEEFPLTEIQRRVWNAVLSGRPWVSDTLTLHWCCSCTVWQAIRSRHGSSDCHSSRDDNRATKRLEMGPGCVLFLGRRPKRWSP